MTDAPVIGAIWPPVAAAIFLIWLAVYSFRRREVSGALPLSVGALFSALWLFGLTMVAVSDAATAKLFWHRFQAVWHMPSVTALVCFALEYAQPGRWLSRRNLVLLSILPLLTAVGVFVPSSALVWRTLEAAPEGHVAFEYSLSGWLLIAYGLGLFVVNIAAYGWLFVRSPAHRWPVIVLLVGAAVSRVLYVLAMAQSVDATRAVASVVAAIVLVWTLYAIALFGFRILDPLGAARQTVIRQMREGMIVFDNAWRVVSVNPAAERILGARAAQLRGRTWAQLLPTVGPPPEGEIAAGAAALEITLGAGAGLRSYALDLSPLVDQRGLRAGSLLLLLDTTAQRRAQMQERALAVMRERERIARELHDSAGQVLAFVNTQGQATRRLLARGNVELADEHLARLVEVAQEADTDLRESILGLRVALADQGLARALAAYLDQYQRRYGIRAELVSGEAVAGTALEPFVEVQLLRIVQEALTNARKHSGARAVRVALECDAACVTVIIRDDGCGFAADDMREREGVGLRVMRERAREVGGDIVVRSTPGEGATIIVTTPIPRGVEGDEHARIAGG